MYYQNDEIDFRSLYEHEKISHLATREIAADQIEKLIKRIDDMTFHIEGLLAILERTYGNEKANFN